MKKAQIKNKLSYFIIILGIWWTIAFLLGTLQAWGMFNHIWILPLGLALSALILFLHHKLYKGIKNNKNWARTLLVVYGIINFIPLLLQIAGIKMPAIDNIIASLIGLTLIYLSRR